MINSIRQKQIKFCQLADFCVSLNSKTIGVKNLKQSIYHPTFRTSQLQPAWFSNDRNGPNFGGFVNKNDVLYWFKDSG